MVEKNVEEEPAEMELTQFVAPHVDDGDARITVTDATSPWSCCGGRGWWHPTAGVLTIDGVQYKWNSRAHRKLRYPKGPAEKHPEKWHHRIRFLGWEPSIVTWWNIWIGEIANTLWVVNGLYATWPELASSEDAATMAIYVTGVVGAFMFIITGYLGFVEAINHSHSPISLPDGSKPSKQGKRRFVRSFPMYGNWPHPLLSTSEHLDEALLLMEGYPLVRDVESGHILTTYLFKRYLKKHADLNGLLGRKLEIKAGSHLLHLTINEIDTESELESEQKDHKSSSSEAGYRWWTWDPDLRQLSISIALVFFISTIIFFIPATVWYPQDKNRNPSNGSLIFWQQVLQIIPCCGFIWVGHASMGEATGSWIKPGFGNLGWWISLFNTIGSYGFMVYAVIAIWGITDPDNSQNLVKWGADFGTFWGSCAFWVAGILACFEFGSRHPILI